MRGLRVKENAPLRSPIAAANSLIAINPIQEVLRLSWSDYIFDSNQNRHKVGGMLLEHVWFAPMIPHAEINRRARKPEGELQEQGRPDSNPGNQESHACIRVFC